MLSTNLGFFLSFCKHEQKPLAFWCDYQFLELFFNITVSVIILQFVINPFSAVRAVLRIKLLFLFLLTGNFLFFLIAIVYLVVMTNLDSCCSQEARLFNAVFRTHVAIIEVELQVRFDDRSEQ